MGRPKIATNKVRVLVDDETVTADVRLPAYTHGQAWKADLRGAEIGAARLTVTGYDSLTTLDVKLQDSDDGESWDDWKAFTQLAANGSEILDMDDERSPKRFVAAYCDVDGSGSAVVRVELDYRQVGPRGEYADGVRDAT